MLLVMAIILFSALTPLNTVYVGLAIVSGVLLLALAVYGVCEVCHAICIKYLTLTYLRTKCFLEAYNQNNIIRI